MRPSATVEFMEAKSLTSSRMLHWVERKIDPDTLRTCDILHCMAHVVI